MADFALVQEIVRSIRNLRAEKAVQPGKRIPCTLVDRGASELLRGQMKVIATLAHLDPAQLSILRSLPRKPAGATVLVAGSTEIYIPLEGLLDRDEERTRLEKELAEATSQIERLGKLLEGDFAHKAPASVVQKEREKLAGYRETAEKLKAQLKG
jgi:valyl-tRNA synthetase